MTPMQRYILGAVGSLFIGFVIKGAWTAYGAVAVIERQLAVHGDDSAQQTRLLRLICRSVADDAATRLECDR